jgi:hypothetical protein
MPYTAGSFPIKKPATVIKAIAEFLKWLEMGKSVKSFSYQDPEDENEICSWASVVRYMKDPDFIKEHGLHCLPEQKERAKSKGYAIWEKHVEDSAIGLNEKANTASLQMIMRNKFGWDKKDDVPEEVDEEHHKPFETVGNFLRAITQSKQADPNKAPADEQSRSE